MPQLLTAMSQLAQIVEQYELLKTYGPLGVFCLWLMWLHIQNLKQQQRTGDSIDRLAKVQLLTMLSLGQLDGGIKKQAQTLLDEVNE